MFNIIKWATEQFSAVVGKICQSPEAAGHPNLKIRKRHHRTTSRKDGVTINEWDEYQIVDCRVIVDRVDTLDEAQRKYPSAVYVGALSPSPTTE